MRSGTCNRRVLAWTSSFLAATCLVVGCAKDRQARPDTLRLLATITPATRPIVQQTPVIDVHLHTFNAQFLPLVGILTAKSDTIPLKSLRNPQSIRSLANYLADCVNDAASADHMAEKHADLIDKIIYESKHPSIQWRLSHDPTRHGQTPKLFYDELIPHPAPTNAAEEADARRKIARKLAEEPRALLQLIAGAIGARSGKDNFLDAALLDDPKVPAAYQNAFGGAIALQVSHMMDLGPIYNQTPDGRRFIDFVSEQIPRMQRQQEAADSRLIYFVAYDPFRADGLDIVKQAIADHGAFGVKVYPPSGYRPTTNPTLEVPCGLSKEAKVNFEARQKLATPAQLNKRMEALLEWCEEKQVPVFAHCSTGEFEAAKGYGRRMAHPYYWQIYLEDHSKKHGKPCTLRLCLGHAGGPVFWFGTRSDENKADPGVTTPEGYEPGDIKWGACVAALCRKYPNVYAEFGASDAIASANARGVFAETLVAAKAEDARSHDADHQYPLLEKLMYGSDWFMPSAPAAYGTKYLGGFRVALLHPSLGDDVYRNFFYLNATRYLDLEHVELREKLPATVKARLIALRSPPQ